MVSASDVNENQDFEGKLDTALLSKGKLKRGPTLNKRRSTIVPEALE